MGQMHGGMNLCGVRTVMRGSGSQQVVVSDTQLERALPWRMSTQKPLLVELFRYTCSESATKQQFIPNHLTIQKDFGCLVLTLTFVVMRMFSQSREWMTFGRSQQEKVCGCKSTRATT